MAYSLPDWPTYPRLGQTYTDGTHTRRVTGFAFNEASNAWMVIYTSANRKKKGPVFIASVEQFGSSFRDA